jgi:hypothetical protein
VNTSSARTPGAPFHQGGEELLGGGVDPMQVPDNHDVGTHGDEPGKQAAEGIQRFTSALLGADRGHRLVPRIDGQERPEVWRDPAALVPESRDPSLDLVCDGRGRVGLIDAEAAPEEIDERVESHGSIE